MANLLNALKSTLRSDERLTIDGQLVKNKIIELALSLDHDLLALLLKNKLIKNRFFTKVGDILVFDKVEFQRFVGNKQFLPDSYTSFKNKIGLTSERGYLSESKEVVLTWPYKDCVLEGGQTKEDQKRKEVFWNEILASDEIDRLLAPKVFTGFKEIHGKGERKISKVTDNSNLVIKGNNLLTLHSLKERYAGKIKLIYIDPPYNTSGATDTFQYNNSFNHSTWLTFIKNRLESSKQILTNDGFIAITIDHAELFYLGSLADEIFGRDNRVGIVTIFINPKGRQHEKFFSATTEYMLVYAKDISLAKFNKIAIDDSKKEEFNLSDKLGNYRLDNFARIRTNTLRNKKPNFWYPIYVSQDYKSISLEKHEGWHEVFPISNGKEYSWKTKPDTFEERNKYGCFIAQTNGSYVEIYNKYYEQQVFKNIWTDKKYFSEFQGTNLLKKLIGKDKFSYPKSLYAVLDTLKIMTKPNDIVLDFFAGSGTTAHAVLELNKQDEGKRKFILCEQMDYIKDVTAKRIQAVLKKESITDSFIYCELAEDNAKTLERINKAKTNKQLISIWKQISNTGFISYKVNPETINKNIHVFDKLSLPEQKRFLFEVLDKNQLYINYSEIDDIDHKVSKEDKKLNKQFYGKG